MSLPAAASWVTPANIGSLIGAGIALALGVVSIVFSVKANNRSSRNEARETEKRDVEWRGQWMEPTLYEIVHVGTTVACDVEATLTVDGELFQESKAEVHPRGSIRFHVPAMRDRLERAEAEWRAAAKDGIFGNPNLTVKIVERVTWRSPLGAPDWHRHEAETSPKEPPEPL